MKREARILASACVGGVCFAYIVRGPGVDGAVSSLEGCSGLCQRASERGYMGELRYSHGSCSCGLPTPPGRSEAAEAYRRLAASISLSMLEVLGMLGRAGDPFYHR
ncbi:hypothetical protein APE_0442a [Aeropyrum pernix K1]|uniref:Uncharacterized protein n=2 Tax=Aeropyrum pernix TaxID=56636 RepID=Q05E70_AERPE|nr:hypothetical protein [Aeropyrum pernix]BAF34731.1 hypothetical protein APE_0442a [Aeropyrum pernix K1]GBF09098.1 hypothetical protein apy_08230 [Aeropyrum pernix]